MKQGGSFLVEPVVEDIFTREKFTEDQKEIEAMVRQFAREKIYPHKEDLAKPNRELSLQLMREAAELGLAGIDVPEAYGGLEMDKITSAMVAEALTMGQSASWVVTFSAHVGIGTLPIIFFGNEEQKQKYLPKLASVEYLGAYALTEPGAGSDALNIKTSAHLSEDGKYYVLNGVKQFITNAGWADLFIVFAKIDDKDFSSFIVERSTPGLTVGPEEQKMGIKGSSTTNLTFENCKVPVENLLGERGKGHHLAFNILNIGRFKLGAADLGGCKTCVTEAVKYASQRRQFGRPIAHFDAIREKLANMAARTFTLDSAIYRTIGMMEERISALDPASPDYPSRVWGALEEYAIEASIAKIYGSETLFHVADDGVQVFGGYGFMEEYPLATIYRDTRIDRIFEGTNEINRMVIYGYYLKKALMEELPIRERVKQWSAVPHLAHRFYAWEINALESLRHITMRCLDRAIELYGQDLRNEQIPGGAVADLLIGLYSATSTLNRVLQMGEAGNRREIKAIVRITLVETLREAFSRFHLLKPILFPGSEWERVSDGMNAHLKRWDIPFNPVEEIRILSNDLLHHNAYTYE